MIVVTYRLDHKARPSGVPAAEPPAIPCRSAPKAKLGNYKGPSHGHPISERRSLLRVGGK